MAKKRANGEGSIRKKPNGRWEGRYTQGIDPNTGRAIQKSVSARTQAECKEKLAKAIRDNRGIPVNHNEDYTVAEWCRLWFETYSKPVIRPNTAKTYENMIENHIVPAIGGVKLKRLTAIQIQKMYNDSKTKGRVQRFEKKTDTALSGSTVRRIHMVLSSALKQAVKERIIPYNPCDNCRIPPKEKKEMTIIPPEKLAQRLRAVNHVADFQLSPGLQPKIMRLSLMDEQHIPPAQNAGEFFPVGADRRMACTTARHQHQLRELVRMHHDRPLTGIPVIQHADGRRRRLHAEMQVGKHPFGLFHNLPSPQRR